MAAQVGPEQVPCHLIGHLGWGAHGQADALGKVAQAVGVKPGHLLAIPAELKG
jgi:hypothetical protein